MSHSQQQTAPGPLPTAPDSPAMGVTVSGNVTKYAMKKKKILNAEESELFELTQAAGIAMDQEVFKIIVDLLKMNVAPLAVFQTLKAMCAGQRIAETSMGDSSTTSYPNTTTAPTEPRVRSKAGAGHGEKSREGSSQRVPRQPSATRGQKTTKSSGSSSSSSQITPTTTN
ncbi:mitotic-spindle organizing protein 2 isoform X2 [Salmo salar]|uniref:Mitotic spindle organizing protein 2B n=2 Tax=Salmo TaxID=8028 RepID=A0A674B118_SALTR|nr:mitotic-spindle organizing protein 2 isoform X2 [Salmo salar]XP_029547967.1 mitotic-spindle organizing protein 2-like isoform X2 [Salmo trutta]|eukprot:XP_013994024.1 PREDICTED: mitotic-spindle organizing protein 2-like isoform X3 [Salmo salar]